MEGGTNNHSIISREALDVAIKIALMFAVIGYCFQIVRPFVLPILWGAIIAIALTPVASAIANRTGLKMGKASALLTVLIVALLIVPTVSFSGSLISGGQMIYEKLQSGSLTIPPPNEAVAGWPLIGEHLFQLWSSASSNLQQFTTEHNEQINSLLTKGATTLGGIGLTLLQFVVSTIIAGVFMSHTPAMNAFFQRLINRVNHGQGEEYVKLIVATVRSVVQGVLGVAVIQSIFAGLGMAVVGVPATGIWMMAVLFLAIIQLPPILILGPVAAYVFTVESSTVSVIFLIWCLAVSGSDAILKPMLMGRGVDIPMLVILLGAIGGMLLSGIVGLFVGAVVLALGYKLLMAWLGQDIAQNESDKVEQRS
ncbi:AI-2E family transporter [Shewanella aestuarii]|uniref:AI-2E family transporter n=1 Tax=Shewanella aestuarii TaxID=1028752 RepID=A0A6G9QFQ0_9GAMM|nr:AI-2E family transporter [Shewanella aestuarii]QIR13350.1 AI-2E family transporter [Shewanella aestuarii]